MISLLLPIRKRPQNFPRFVRSLLETAEDSKQVELLVYADNDDPESERVVLPTLFPEGEENPPFGIQFHCGPRKSAVQKWNMAAGSAKGDLVMLCGDDLVFRTSGWDRRIHEAFGFWPDGIGLVYCNDGYRGKMLACHPTVSKAWIRAAGYFLPERFHHYFVDNWLQEIATGLKRIIYLGDVLIEHLHPACGKAERDETYRSVYRFWTEDQMTFLYSKAHRDQDAERIEQAIIQETRRRP